MGAPEVGHPALGRPSPSLEALRARSDTGALALWDAAAALVAWREQREADAELEPRPRPRAIEPGIGGWDLARAILALRPELLGDGFAVSETWRARIGEARCDRLAHSWGRRWAWLEPRAIGAAEMVRAIPPLVLWRLARLSPAFRDGLVVASEAYARLFDDLGRRGLTAGPAPRAWLDPGVELEPGGPGYAFVGPPGSGKRTLMAHLTKLLGPRPINVDNFHGGVDVAIDRGLVCGWTCAHRLDPTVVQRAVDLAADPDAGFQLVIAAEPEQWSEIRSRVPSVDRLAVIERAPPADDELLAIWLCQRPLLEDLLGTRVDLGWLIARFDELRAHGPAVDVARATLAALDLGSRGLVDPELKTAPLAGAPEVPGWLRRLGDRDVEHAWRSLVRAYAWVEPLVPSAERLGDLLELDAALSGRSSGR